MTDPIKGSNPGNLIDPNQLSISGDKKKSIFHWFSRDPADAQKGVSKKIEWWIGSGGRVRDAVSYFFGFKKREDSHYIGLMKVRQKKDFDAAFPKGMKKEFNVDEGVKSAQTQKRVRFIDQEGDVAEKGKLEDHIRRKSLKESEFPRFFSNWLLTTVDFLAANGVQEIEKALIELYESLETHLPNELKGQDLVAKNMSVARDLYISKLMRSGTLLLKERGDDAIDYLSRLQEKGDKAFRETAKNNPLTLRGLAQKQDVQKRLALRVLTSTQTAYENVKPFIDDFKKGDKLERAQDFLRECNNQELAELLALTLYFVEDQDLQLVVTNLSRFLENDRSLTLSVEHLIQKDSILKAVYDKVKQKNEVDHLLEGIDKRNVELGFVKSLPQLKELYKVEGNRGKIDNFIKENHLPKNLLTAKLEDLIVHYSKTRSPIADHLLFERVSPQLLDKNPRDLNFFPDLKGTPYEKQIKLLKVLYSHYQENKRALRVYDFRDNELKREFLNVRSGEVETVLRALYPGAPLGDVVEYVKTVHNSSTPSIDLEKLKKEVALKETPNITGFSINVLTSLDENNFIDILLNLKEANPQLFRRILVEVVKLGDSVLSDRVVRVIDSVKEGDVFAVKLYEFYREKSKVKISDDAYDFAHSAPRKIDASEVIKAFNSIPFETPAEFKVCARVLMNSCGKNSLDREGVKYPQILAELKSETEFSIDRQNKSEVEVLGEFVRSPMIQNRLKEGASLEPLLYEAIFRAFPQFTRLERRYMIEAAIDALPEKVKQARAEEIKKIRLYRKEVSRPTQMIGALLAEVEAEIQKSYKGTVRSYEGFYKDHFEYLKPILLRRYQRLSPKDQKIVLEELGLGGIATPFIERNIKQCLMKGETEKVEELVVNPLHKLVGNRGPRPLLNKIAALKKELFSINKFFEENVDNQVISTVERRWNHALAVKNILEKKGKGEGFEWDSLLKKYGSLGVAEGIALIEDEELKKVVLKEAFKGRGPLVYPEKVTMMKPEGKIEDFKGEYKGADEYEKISWEQKKHLIEEIQRDWREGGLRWNRFQEALLDLGFQK
jgi:hypothetical protein